MLKQATTTINISIVDVIVKSVTTTIIIIVIFIKYLVHLLKAPT